MLTMLRILLAFASIFTLSLADRVKVNFYGEFSCPYCQKFLSKDVGRLYDSGFLAQHVDFRYVPYGNAKVVDGKVCTV